MTGPGGPSSANARTEGEVVSFDITASRDAAIVHVDGDVALACQEKFDDALKRALGLNPARLVVSLAKCRYIDSTGIGVLVRTRKAGHELGVVVTPHSSIERIFAILNLREYLALSPTLEAALQ